MGKDNMPTKYRPCVGVMLVNRDGKIFVGKRIDHRETWGSDSDFWQMPQGGVDKGEDLQVAAYRELAEETGVSESKASVIAVTKEAIRYDLPDSLMGKLWKGKYRGQEQIWYLMRFAGDDDDIDLAAHDPQEFCEWKWVDAPEIVELIVPFKKHIYRSVLDEFSALI
ncbi:MAG: RNA pyrophosphohydrolase [Erythrobacter sp.]